MPQETITTPTYGCRVVADYLLDFQTSDGISDDFRNEVENAASEIDMFQSLAERIDEATGSSLMLDALHDALEDITGPITSVGIRIRFSTLEKVKAAIQKATEG